MKIENAAMVYLYSVEDETCHISMAQDRAACGEYSLIPVTASDILAWMEDELQIQHEQARFHPEEGRDEYVLVLVRDCAVLRQMGIKPNLDVFHKRTAA